MNQQRPSFADAWMQASSSLDWQGQADWLSGLRQSGLEDFRANGLPGRAVERWKYTRLTELDQRLPVSATPALNSASVQAKPLVRDGVRVLFVDGGDPVIEGNLPAGVQMHSLEQALSGDRGELKALLQGLDTGDSAAALAALNTASLRHGLFLKVPAGTDAGDVLVQWAASEGSSEYLANARLCIILEAGARLNLIEQFESAEDVVSQANVVTQVRLAPEARLDHVRLVQENEQAILVTTTEVHQSGDSHYGYTGLDFGGGTVRHDVRARLREPGASCSLNGACLTRGSSHVDNHLDAEHHAMNCESRQYFRAVLADRSRTVFNGRVFVAAGADGTDAQQSSAALLLSPLAEINSKPELEIYADEVVAAHGATVGQLDRNQLFYLQSRGLDETTARTLLTMAFCRSVIEHLDNASLRETLEQRLEDCLRAVGIDNG